MFNANIRRVMAELDFGDRLYVESGKRSRIVELARDTEPPSVVTVKWYALSRIEMEVIRHFCEPVQIQVGPARVTAWRKEG